MLPNCEGGGMSLSILNYPASRLPGPSLLHELVQTNPQGQHPAVDFLPPDGACKSLSYKQLHDASDSLAISIWKLARSDGISKKFIVPVLLPQGPELYIALLAILKAGGAFCPLNLDVPLERARFILQDVSATVVVTSSKLASRIPADSEQTAILRIDETALSSQATPSRPSDLRVPLPSDLAYVMYTSGSTGTPKGVGVSHDAATQSLLAHDRHIPQFSRFLQFAAPTFDVSVFEIFFPFFRGKTLVSCTRPAMLNDLPGVLRTMNVDACELTPTVAGSLLRKRESAPGLKLLLTIGEMLTKPVVEEFGSGPDGKESILWAMYGPTEAAIHCTLQPAFAYDSGVGNIGIPFDTVSAFILPIPTDDDRQGQPDFTILPRGEVGELVVGGYQVADGYLNRQEMTAKAFIDTPYGRLYRTGDKARIRADGTLECLGRISEGQVKLRGQRIELGEIEHAALRTTGCHGAFAAVIRNILVLFCAVDDNQGGDIAASIQKSCGNWLPGYMVPGDVIIMKEFPRLPSGKVDRKTMVAEYTGSTEGHRGDQGSAEARKSKCLDEVEEKMCSVASQVLGVEIAPNQHLSRAGMDSLVAIKFASSLRNVGIEATVADILRSPTISALRGHVEEAGKMISSSPSSSFEVIGSVSLDISRLLSTIQSLKSLSENDIAGVYPCTPLQSAMLAETKANPGAYCNWVELSVPPEHDEAAIVSCFQRIAQENEALRTGFVHDGDRFLQVVFTHSEPSVATFVDTARLVKEFELSTDSEFLHPFRLQVAKTQDRKGSTIVVQIHHAVYDGWSMDMILSDLEALLAGSQKAVEPAVNGIAPSLQGEPQTFKGLVKFPKVVTQSFKALTRSSRALVRISREPQSSRDPTATSTEPAKPQLKVPLSALPPKSQPQFHQVVAYYESSGFQQDCEAAREYWAATLAGFQPPPLPILCGEEQPPSGVASTSVTFDIPSELVKEALTDLDVPPQTVFQAAVAWLWGALTGVEDVVIGAVTSGRTLPVPNIENILGPCIASVPIRTNLARVMTVQDLITSIHAANRAVLRHGVLPLSEIKKVAGFRPGQSLYDALFVYQESLHSKSDSARKIKQVSQRDYLETKMLIEIEPSQGVVVDLESRSRFRCRLTYHTHCFTEAYIDIFGASIEALAVKMFSDVTLELSSLQRAFPREIQSAYNVVPQRYKGTPDLALAVEATAARCPEEDALCFAEHISEDVFKTTRVTYSGLNKMANRIAWLLRQHGASEGEAVAIVMEKSVLLYAGILAIVKVGCAYLPLLPSTPLSRVDTIFRQASIKLCLTDTATKAAFGDSIFCRLMDIESVRLDAFPISNPDHTVDPSRLSYIIYTSGSTGTPKGVCVTQLNIMSNLDVLSRIYPVSNDSRLLQSCSQAFDVSVFEIFFAWTQGMCLCSAPNDVLFADLEHSIRKLGITHLSMTPTVASLINPLKVPQVQFLVTSGEAMTEVVARKWARQLYQGYGPSETTNICSVKKMSTKSGEPIIQHLGWSFENTSTFVLFQDSSELAPKGCFGELCFGGDQVAQGYLNMPQLTATKFIDHPRYGRLYRSGDLGRMLPDGSMVITGRVDDQIKIRGQRVELGEISTNVGEHESVADCTTLYLKGSDSGNGQIIVFIVPKKAQDSEFQVLDMDKTLSNDVQDIYRQLTARIPGYMVPSLIIPVTVLPVTPAGKLDRRRLGDIVKGLDQAYLTMTARSLGPDTGEEDGSWTDVEKQIAGILAAVFSVEQTEIRKWTPLTTLGLDSISAIRVSKRLQETLNIRIAISTILRNPSVGKLTEALSGVPHQPAVSSSAKATELLPVEVVKSVTATLHEHGKRAERILPCTPLQEAMLVASGRGSYLNAMLFRIIGSSESLVAAWKTMCKRHSILRTCFVSTENHRWPVAQAVLDDWEHPWLRFDQTQNDVKECVADHAKTLPNALDSFQPAVSFAIISKASDIYLSFICHHALYDGIAMERLLFEVEQVISGVHLLPPPPYEAFLHESLQSQSGHSVDFWLKHLGGHKPKLLTGFSLKADERKPDLSSQAITTRKLELSLSQINDLTRQLGVSLLSVAQSAWAVTLAKILQTDDVCFGNVLSGRTLAIDRIEELVAPCFNTVPLRMHLAQLGPRNLDLMKAFQALSAEVLQHQFTPLRRILQSLTPPKEGHAGGQSGRLVLFDSLLLLQHPPRPLDTAIWTLEMDDGSMDVPAVCEVIPDTQLNSLIINLHLEPNLFPFDFPGLVLDLFSNALYSLLKYPESHLQKRNSVPSELAERLKRLPFEEQLGVDFKTAISADDGDWTRTESAIRDVLFTLSSYPLARIRRNTTIYQLGLDSISAVQIASLLRKQGLNLTASDVISNPTCEGLASHVDKTEKISTEQGPTYDLSKFQHEVKSQIDAHGIPLDMVEDVLPCSPLQAGMMNQFIQSGGRDYFNYIDFRLDDSIDLKVMVDAWKTLHQAHPILRTTLVPIEHKDHPFAMVQLAPSSSHVPVSIYVGEQAKGFHVDKWRLDAAHSASATTHGQLWNVALVRTEKGTMLYLAIHHCLYDAHSLQSLLADLARAVRGEQVEPPPRDNISAAVISILSQISSSAESAQEFWARTAEKTVINSFPVMTPLRESSRQTLVESTTSSMCFSNLERAVADAGYSIQIILQAAWTRILSSYLGEASVVFGVVLSGRNSETTQNTMFPCITTLPVISKHSSSNHDLLQDMMGYNAALFKQQHQPLTRIQNWLGMPDNRLFDTLLVYQKSIVDASDTRPWSIVNEQAVVDYPVSIEVEPQQGDKLRYQITFFSDVIPKEQARIILQQFDAVVKQLALNPTGSEDDLTRLCPDLFSVLPPDQPELSAPVTFLHQFVEKQAAESPHATALHFVESLEGDRVQGRKWTYQELNDNGNRVANMILPNVKTGDLVAINFEKCPEAYFSILGVLKAGCAFVALDPGAPAARKQFILEDSGASLVLSSPAQRSGLDSEVSIPVVIIGEQGLDGQPSHQPVLSRQLEPGDTCYCLYTSGTTGVPKGCEITHDNAVQCMLAFREIFQGRWTPYSRWLQFASLHFDVSVLEQYWSWSVGITLVGAPRDLILEDLARTINKLQITHIDLTPSLARLVHPEDVPSLCNGVFITGGEALKQEILDVWGSWGVIYNFYGPTEATIGVTVYPRVPRNGRASNIGRQFINVGSYVLRPGTSIPVLKGAVGELCVSGKLVGKGYLRRDDLTAERFPTLDQFGERVYRTGDLVRVLHDGCFDFLGRADDQVKLRGQRLEIGEINHAIRTGVDEIKDVATIVVRNDKQQKDFLVSFVTAETAVSKGVGSKLHIVNSTASQDLCRRARLACQAKLPGYMVPTYILQLLFIPLSANNKAEIKKLKRLFQNLPQEDLVTLSSLATATGTTTFTETSSKIARLIATKQSLDFQTLSPASNIFELGIDSISVLGLARALRKEGLLHANPGIILKNPVLADLAIALDAQAQSSNASVVAAARQMVQACGHRHRSHVCTELGITADQIEYIAPCSPLQAGMISRSAQDGLYFNSFRFQRGPHTCISTLRGAWQKTVDAYPILRTRFVKTIDGYVQVALKDLELPSQEIGLMHNGETRMEDMIQLKRDAWITDNSELLARPFEILILDNEVLVLHIFHGLYDAISLELILNRVASECSSLMGSPHRQVSVEDAIKVPSFLDALCHGPLQDFGSCKRFWTEHLKAANFELLPPMESSQSNGAVRSVVAKQEISFHDLEFLKKRLGVTHQAIVQGAWCWALAEHFSVSPTIGMIVSGRTMELDGAEKVVGPLFNTLPFHLPVGSIPDLNWASILRHCSQFNTSVVAFQHIPLRDIQKWCSGGKPLFDVLFSFQREENPGTERGALWKDMESEPNPDYPLALEATLTPNNRLQLLIVGDRTAIGENDVQALLRLLESSLTAMVQNPDEAFKRQGARETPVDHAACTTGRMIGDPDRGLFSDFTWTEQAILLRDEMARLAGVAPEIITDKTSILELGLDSIDLIKLSAVLKRHGIIIKTSQLMKARTIPAILHLRSLDGNAPNGVVVNGASKSYESYHELRELLLSRGYSAQDLSTVLPATPLQDSMVAEMIESSFQLYYNHDILQIAPDVDIGRLKEAWIAVIRGSPILRTTFLPTNDPRFDFAYCQVVTAGHDPNSYVTELDIQSEEELAQLVDAATQRAREAGGKSHLVQLAVVSGPDRNWLVLSIAHALYDGRSLDLLHQDVKAAYEGRYERRPAYEPYLEDVILSQSPEAQTFWSGFLDGAVPTLVAERPDASAGHKRIHRAEAASTLPLSTLKTFCKQHAITTQTLGEACMAALLATLTASLDVTFGVVLSGRDSEEAQNLMFPTMNTVAVRSVLHGTVSSWVQYMQDNTTNIASFSHFPLRKAKKLVKGVSGPLFNSLFIQQRRPETRVLEGKSKGSVMNSVDGISAVEYPVCIEMEVGDESLIWRIACDDACIPKPEVSVLLHQLDLVLAFMVREPDADVIKFSGQSVSVCGLIEFTPGSFIGEEDKMDAQVEEHAPPSPTEETIIRVLADVSGVPASSIVRTHNIYNLGLDSIGAMRVASALSKEEITLKFRDIAGAKSIRDMARLVDVSRMFDVKGGLGAGKTPENVLQDDQDPRTRIRLGFGDYLEADDPVSDISVQVERESPSPEGPMSTVLTQFNCGLSKERIERVIPATAMQVHMLAVWLNTDGKLFFPEFKYRLSGDITTDEIGAAWSKLVAETPVLRTVFCTTTWEDVPVLQIVLKPDIDTLDATRHLPESEIGVQSRTWDSTDIQREVVGPWSQLMPSLTATKQGDGSWLLRLRIHHALYDAVSLPSIMRRFVNLCSPVETKQNGQYGHIRRGVCSAWTAMIRKTYSTETKEFRRKFWLEYLAGTEFDPLNSWPNLKQSTNSRISVVQDNAIGNISELRSLCGKNGVSIQALFLAAYAKFLACARRISLSGSGDSTETRLLPERRDITPVPKHVVDDRHIVFGIYLANRIDLDSTDDLASYPTLCLVPLRVHVKRGKNLLEMAAQVQEGIHAISAPETVGLGLWELQRWTGRTIDSFVNFLSFPGADEGNKTGGEIMAGSVNKVRLEEVPFNDNSTENSSKELEPDRPQPEERYHPSLCEKLSSQVRNAYPDAVDVETSIRDDDSMTIGCFGPSQKLGDENGAREVIGRIVQILSSPEDR
ncbi:nonribosomal peptide synthase [Naviculisporaceae sp. PSN 640]